MNHHLTVRAIDLGYGHIKFTTGRDPETGLIVTDSFPSQSPVTRKQSLPSKVMTRRDTAIVPVNGIHYEVGKEVAMAMEANYEGEILDEDFPLSDAYKARLYGALNYMVPTLGSSVIDYLVLGLPMTTIRKHSQFLMKQFVGDHQIDVNGHSLTIKQVEVFPQPLGSYMAYLASLATPPKEAPMALVVDPGFNTIDWYVIKGVTPADIKCKAVNCAVGKVMEAMADAIIAPIDQGGATEAQGATLKEIQRRIDMSFVSGKPFTLCGRPIDLRPYMKNGQSVIEEAAQSIKNSIGQGGDIDVILMTGGGATLFKDAVQRKFPNHHVEVLAEPAFANVRGFQFLGEKLARSAERARVAAA